MGVAAKVSSHIPSTWGQNAIHSLPIIHIITSHMIYVAFDNPSLVTSGSCLTRCSYLSNDMRAAENISHTENL